MVARASARNVKQVPLGVVDLFEIGVVSNRFDPRLQRNDLVVACHHHHGAKLEHSAVGMFLRVAPSCFSVSTLIGGLSEVFFLVAMWVSVAPAPSRRPERVFDRQPFDALAVLQVFAEQAGAARFQRGGDDEGVVEAELVALLQVQRAGVKRCAGLYAPQRGQNIAQKIICVRRVGNCKRLSGSAAICRDA